MRHTCLVVASCLAVLTGCQPAAMTPEPRVLPDKPAGVKNVGPS